MPRGEGMAFHLTGTDFYEAVSDPDFETTRPYWEQTLVSETPEVYRGEYLAASILFDAEEGKGGLSLTALRQGDLLETVRAYAAERYDEGYERGLHDQDAALILGKLLALHQGAGLLRFGPRPRAWAALFWAFCDDPRRSLWELRARSLSRLRTAFAPSRESRELTGELAQAIAKFLDEKGIPTAGAGLETIPLAGAYLAEELAAKPVRFTTGAEAVALRDGLLARLRESGEDRAFDRGAARAGERAGRALPARAGVAGGLPGERRQLLRHLLKRRPCSSSPRGRSTARSPTSHRRADRRAPRPASADLAAGDGAAPRRVPRAARRLPPGARARLPRLPGEAASGAGARARAAARRRVPAARDVRLRAQPADRSGVSAAHRRQSRQAARQRGGGEAHRPDGHAPAHLAAGLRQDHVDGICGQPPGPRLHESERSGPRPFRALARSGRGAQRHGAPGGGKDQSRPGNGQQRPPLPGRHPAHRFRAAPEIHFAVRRAAQDRRRLEREDAHV